MSRARARAALDPDAAIADAFSSSPLPTLVRVPPATMVVYAEGRPRIGRARLWLFLLLVRAASWVCRFEFELRDGHG